MLPILDVGTPIQSNSVSQSARPKNSFSPSRRLVFLPDPRQPSAPRPQNSNRHTYEKLEPCVSYRKHSPEVISNRHKNALCPRCGAKNQGARGAAPKSDPMAPNPVNIIPARKLEILLSAKKSTTSKFLIDKFLPLFKSTLRKRRVRGKLNHKAIAKRRSKSCMAAAGWATRLANSCIPRPNSKGCGDRRLVN